MTAPKHALLTLCLLLSISYARAQRPELVVQTGHSSNVNSFAFSPDGRLLASASNDNTVKLWDLRPGLELRTLAAHTSVSAVAFSPDGRTLASGGSEGPIKLWDVSTGAELRSFKVAASVHAIAFSSDGRLLAGSSWDRAIRLWDVHTGIELLTLPDAGYAVAFSPDGTKLAGAGTKNLKLWKVPNGAELRTLSQDAENYQSIVFSPDGSMLVTGGSDRVTLWDMATGAQVRSMQTPGDSVAFSPNGKILATGVGSQSLVKIWDVSTGAELGSLALDGLRGSFMAFSSDGWLFAVARDQTVKIFDTATGVELRTLEGHLNQVRSVAFSPDGRTLASGNGNRTISLWELGDDRGPRTFKVFGDVHSVAFSPDSRLLAGSSRDPAIRLWDVRTGIERRALTGHTQMVESIVFSPNGKMLASGSWDNSIIIWDVASGAELRTLKRHTDVVTSVAFSPDGHTLASGSWDRSIRLWNAATGAELRVLAGHADKVSAIAFSPDARTLASGGWDGSIKLWDTATGRERRTLVAGRVILNSLAFSPDGSTLASSDWGGSIKLWEAATGKELRTLAGHNSATFSVAFSPDGKMLASGGDDAKTKLWDIGSGDELTSLIALETADWVVATPDGLFDGSPAAYGKLIWRASGNTLDYAPIEAYFSDSYYPGLLTDLHTGKRPRASSDISQKDRRQPELKLTLANNGGNSTVREGARNLAVKIDITESAADKDHKTGTGAQDVRLLRNGSLVKVWRGDVLKGQTSVTLEATVPIVAGENKFTAYAFNHDNIKSSDAWFVITGADSLKRQGTAYVLAIGVNNYSNQNYNLKYAVADAEDFATEVKRQQESLKRYAKVEVISLSDAQATRANIAEKLADLAKQVQPEDAVIVFFAGHGTANGNQFYLIPHDLGYEGPRDKLDEAGLQKILAHSVSDRELEKLFEGIDAGQFLLVIDACNSGQALEAEEKRRGPMNSKGLAQLAYEKGMYVLTAAQSYQAAQEAARFGHGFLTYALVEEGLKQGAADREPKNGSIDIREWLNFATDEVPRMQEENSVDALRGRGRYIVFVGDGREVGIPKTEADSRDNIQRPRVFYRREVEGNSLVIGVGNKH